MNTLKSFNDPKQVALVERSMLSQFLERRPNLLSPEATALLSADLTHEQFCAAWAAYFAELREDSPLFQILLQIETLALPENQALLDTALSATPECRWVNRNHSALHQCVHLWLFSEGDYGVSFPIPPTSSLLAAPRAESPTCDSLGCSGTKPQVSCPNDIPEPCKGETPPSAPSDSGIRNTEHAPVLRSFSEGGIRFPNGSSVPNNPSIHKSIPPSSSSSFSCSSSIPGLSAAVSRLSRLPSVEYELARRAEAKRLGLRLRALDDAVEAVRIHEDDAEAERIGLSQLKPWPEPITDAPSLFDEIHARSLMYLHLPPGAAVVLALWPAHAHAIRAFTQTPRLNLTSTEPGSGKSTVLSFLATLSPKVLRTDNLKTAVLFRIVERHQPTLLLDEVDTYIHLYPELRGLLNAGHDPDACVHRIENHKVRSFRSFAPTALAGLGQLAPTLRDRSLVIALSKAPPGSLQARLDKRKLEPEYILGQKLARWTQDNFDAIAACDPSMPTHNRLADNWRPLFSIAHVIGGRWPERILESFNQLTQPSLQNSSTPPLQPLLTDIREIFVKAGVTRMSCKQLAQALMPLGHRPSGNSFPDDPRWLSRELRKMGIHSHNLRIANRQAKAYDLPDFSFPS